ncbi:Plasmid pRiA4b ORF-3-like protein [Opitutaceae bacterium TAV1]|nr:Plasmid pRiA4b ORF-3-like protein [Opitutaceae bacterium TAV1]
MQEFHFKIQYDDFTAELAVGGDQSLYALAEFIIKAVGFDFDHAFQFCDNLKRPYRSKECYTLFADIGEDDDNPGVKKTRLSEVFRPRRKMIFHFDYGDDWFFLVTCTAIKESSAKRPFKKVVATQGTPPTQYPGEDL